MSNAYGRSRDDDDNLGSLAQSARSQQLRSARNILFFVGGWLLVSLGIEWLLFNSELNKIRGMIINQAALNRAYNIMYVLSAGYVLLGILYFIFGMKVKQHPVPITITALVLFLGLQMALAAFIITTFPDEEKGRALSSGIILKIIVIVGLVKSIQAAIAYEAERKKGSSFDDYADRRPAPRDDRDDDRDRYRDDRYRDDRDDDPDDDRRGRSKKSERDDW